MTRPKNLHNPTSIAYSDSVLAVLRRMPGARVSAYDVATKCGLSIERTRTGLQTLAKCGKIERVDGDGRWQPKNGPAVYRLVEVDEAAS